ncbi:hypothetical protein I5H99_gp068 [Mycobacterium phage WillSterrel]|uniref:Uncharacterized protein n=1 Tax=Mycobacterium phage WillSterrel TaxID=1897769 RepID=A0A1C9M041_9CAUD|nr:hypothetical protein I5H99_gp068 [Mycobacterium phage WillSterrel]AOQ28521.1 hypothetical protein SEA_WILLSTERREL_68 [Mycobacterium phage WillSterrel]AYQ99583.1 hypothetical protein PBI_IRISHSHERPFALK_68 [Mycobacterium phage IrishSherpFalk]
MNRPVFYVDQKEDLEKGTFWWTVSTANGTKILASEMYSRRRSAKRAALVFIKAVGVPVVFRYWTGSGEQRRRGTETRKWGVWLVGVVAGGGGGGGKGNATSEGTALQ